MKKHTVFRGVATALITPFKDGKIDFEALSELIEFQEKGNVSALVVAGTTGEAPTLTPKEHAELINFVARNTSLPLIAGCGSNCTKQASVLAESAYNNGADALLAVTPYYNKATPEGLYEHFCTVADSAPIPLILYNVPSRTGVTLDSEVCHRLSEHGNIVGIKQASADMSSCARIMAECRDLDLYCGNDDITVPMLSLGAKGIISVLSNILPAETAEMCALFESGQTALSAQMQLDLLPLINMLFRQVNPVPVKCAAAMLGMCREEYRLPLCPLSYEEKHALKETLQKYIK